MINYKNKQEAVMALIENTAILLEINKSPDFNYEDIKFQGEDKFTENDFLREAQRIQDADDATKYQRDRANEYPTLTEQEDMKYWDAINGTTVWLDTITEIKNKYPKGA